MNWLLGAGALFGVIYILTHVQLRYRAPIEPLMAVVVGMLVSCGRTACYQAVGVPVSNPF